MWGAKMENKQIEEMAKIIYETDCAGESCEYVSESIKKGIPFSRINTQLFINTKQAERLYEQGYRKTDENSVVISKEEINNADYFYVKDGELIPVEKGRGKFITTEWYTELLMKMPLGHELAKERKETAEKIFNDIFALINNAKDKSLKIFGNNSDYGKGYKNSVNHFNEHIFELAKKYNVEIKEPSQ